MNLVHGDILFFLNYIVFVFSHKYYIFLYLYSFILFIAVGPSKNIYIDLIPLKNNIFIQRINSNNTAITDSSIVFYISSDNSSNFSLLPFY